jgi:hypothetical protein
VAPQVPVFVLEGQQFLALGGQILLHVSGGLMQLLVDDVFVGLVGDRIRVVVVVVEGVWIYTPITLLKHLLLVWVHLWL